MSEKYSTYANSLSRMQKEKRFRTLKPMIPINGAFILLEDQKWLSFCSHDYLALAESPDIKKNAIKYLLQHGITASSETQDLYLKCQKQLEEKIASMLRRETALFFPSRYEANLTALAALGHKRSTLFLDEASHPGLLHGAQASRGQLELFPHNRLDRLEELLANSTSETKIIVTESIFSLTGTVSNLPTLIELADHFGALLYVDDSHAFGVAGVEGMGLCAHLPEVDVIVGSFSKACGAYGGYVASSKTLRDYLVNVAPIKTSYLFPPPIIGAIEAALELIPHMEGERKQLQQRCHWLRSALAELGFEVQKTSTPLITLNFDSDAEVEALREHLEGEKILVGATRTLRNEKGLSRLNIPLNVCHMPDHLSRLTDAIKAWQVETPTAPRLATF